MTIRRSLLVPALLLALVGGACTKDEAPPPPPQTRPGELHVHVDSTGGVELNGRAMSLDSAKRVLARQKDRATGIYYTRENPAGKPTPEQWVAFMHVSEVGLPIRFEADSQSYQPPR